MVEHAPERVGGVVALRRVLDRLRDRDPEAAGRVGKLLEDRAPTLGVARRARDDLRAPELDHRAPERLLLVRDANHVDLALEADQLARERERAPPLAGAGLGREPRPALLLVVVRLRHGGVRLVAAGWADALVLVEDARLRPDGLLEPARPVERRGTPEAVHVEDLLRNRDLRLVADLLLDQGHREERRQVVRPERVRRCPDAAPAAAGSACPRRRCTSAAEAATHRAGTSSAPRAENNRKTAGGATEGRSPRQPIYLTVGTVTSTQTLRWSEVGKPPTSPHCAKSNTPVSRKSGSARSGQNTPPSTSWSVFRGST